MKVSRVFCRGGGWVVLLFGVFTLGCDSCDSKSSPKTESGPVTKKESSSPEEEKIEIAEASLAKIVEEIASHKGKVVLVDIWAEF
jgi:hypothetical protein